MDIAGPYLSAFALGTGLASAVVTTQNIATTRYNEDRSYLNTQNQSTVLAMLREIEKDCALPGWDGEKAVPVAGIVVEHAKLIVNSIPFTVVSPELSPQSNGKIAFEWYGDPSHQLLLSIGGTSDVGYSALLGSKRIVGWEQLSLVGDLIEEMRAVYKLIPSAKL